MTNEVNSTILVVEDEPKLAAVLMDYLRAVGYQTQWLSDGRDVVPAVKKARPDLILLDLMLPGRDGMDICRELRSLAYLPIVMVTARVEEIDLLLGLDLGADDYICKPFSPREVLARVKAILRRVSRVERGEPTPLWIDEASFTVSLKGKSLKLTPVQFRLLQTLASSPGRVFSRDQLLDKAYIDHRVVTDRTVDSHVNNLRRKLEQASPDLEMIQSIYGRGYRLSL